MAPATTGSRAGHQRHEGRVVGDDVVLDVVALLFVEGGEELSGARNLGLFDVFELERGKRALGFSDEVDVPDLAVVEGDGPVRVVVADRGRNEEAAGSFA